MTEFQAEDIRLLREQGDFKAYLDHVLSGGDAPAEKPATVPVQRTGDHRPGAWPAECRPPQATPELPAETVAVALEEYRCWIAAGCPEGNFACECTACQQLLGGPQ